MPVYEYLCTTCDQRFSRRKSMSASDEPDTCEAGHSSRRVFSVPAGVASKGGSSGPSGAVGDINTAAAWQGNGGCGGGCACH